MATQYTSIDIILDDILQHPILRKISVDAIVRHTIKFMKKIGCPLMFNEKVEHVNIVNYRGILPCDFFKVIQIRDAKTKECYHETTDSFHMAHGNGKGGELTYKIQGGIIFTSEEKRDVEIAYTAIVEDANGFPLIPDNEKFISALESYIKVEYFTVLFESGKLNANVLINAQTEYAFNAGQCQNEFVKLTIDQAESLSRSLNSMIERHYSQREGFVRNGYTEHINKH